MSGGSFDYLCFKEAEDLFTRSPRDQLARMAAELTERGYADAAAETERLSRLVEHAIRQVDARREALTDVWKAVEWCCSGDVGDGAVDEAIKRYREA